MRRWLLGGILADDVTRDCPGLMCFRPSAAGINCSEGDGGDADDVTRGDAGRSAGRARSSKVFRDVYRRFGEDDFLSDDAMLPFAVPSVSRVRAKNFAAVEK